MNDYIKLYHASNDPEGISLSSKEADKFEGRRINTFDGFFAKRTIEEQFNMIKAGKYIYHCDISASKIAARKDLIKNDDALSLICREIRTSDFNIADMLADLVFTPKHEQTYSCNDLVGIVQTKISHDQNASYEMKIKALRFEIIRIMGRVAKQQGYDALRLMQPGGRVDILVVSESVHWIKD